MQLLYHYKSNKAFYHSILFGCFYLLLGIWTEHDKNAFAFFITTMLFLPGITFPLSTTYCTIRFNKKKYKLLFHFLLSIAIYFLATYGEFSENGFRGSLVIAGGLGSTFYWLITKFLLHRRLKIKSILICSVFSGLSFLPSSLFDRFDGMALPLLGLSIFLWTITNGIFINSYYHR